MKGAYVRKSACGSKGERGTFVDLFRGSAEDGAEFEEAHVADVAMEVSGDGRKHAGNERRAQHAGFIVERIADWHYLARCRRGKCGIGGRTEGAGDGFVKSGSEQRAADGGFGFGPRQGLHAFAECGKRVSEAVVSVDARDFFDEIDFAFEVEAPTGKLNLPRIGLRSVAGESASKAR